MRIPLAQPFKSRTGVPDKDSRLKNSYVEVKGDKSIVRKRPIAQGDVAVGTGTAQGGIGFTINGTPYFIGFWGDTLVNYTGNGTNWDSGTTYPVGSMISYNFINYWAINENTNSEPPSADWSEKLVEDTPVAILLFRIFVFNPDNVTYLIDSGLQATESSCHTALASQFPATYTTTSNYHIHYLRITTNDSSVYDVTYTNFNTSLDVVGTNNWIYKSVIAGPYFETTDPDLGPSSLLYGDITTSYVRNDAAILAEALAFYNPSYSYTIATIAFRTDIAQPYSQPNQYDVEIAGFAAYIYSNWN